MVPPQDIEVARSAVRLPDLIGRDLKLSRAGSLWAGCCPFHPDRSPSFYTYDDHWHCFGCGAHGDAIDWLTRTRRLSFADAVAQLLGGSVPNGSAALVADAKARRERDAAQRERNIRLAAEIWREAVDPAGTPAETYVRFRLGLRRPGVILPTSLRYDPYCMRGSDWRAYCPAMIGLVVSPGSGLPVGVHRTFLRHDGPGKADVAKPKMLLGDGGVVRLSSTGSGLAVCEGIETGLAIKHLLGFPGHLWATLGTATMASLQFRPDTSLDVFADAGAPGVAAAEKCAERWRSGVSRCMACSIQRLGVIRCLESPDHAALSGTPPQLGHLLKSLTHPCGLSSGLVCSTISNVEPASSGSFRNR